MSDLERLAGTVLASDWFHRHESPDVTWCSYCNGTSSYHDYSLTWHGRDCPIRLACSVLGTNDPLGTGNRVRTPPRTAKWRRAVWGER